MLMIKGISLILFFLNESGISGCILEKDNGQTKIVS